MNRKDADAEIERIIIKEFYKSSDLKLFNFRPEHIEVRFDSHISHNAEVTRGYPCKVVFGIGSLKFLKQEINQILQHIQKNNMIQPMAVVKYKHVRNEKKKWDREFIHSTEQGIFRLLSNDEIITENHQITILRHATSDINVSFVGNNPNIAKMKIELSKKVADFYSQEKKA